MPATNSRSDAARLGVESGEPRDLPRLIYSSRQKEFSVHLKLRKYQRFYRRKALQPRSEIILLLSRIETPRMANGLLLKSKLCESGISNFGAGFDRASLPFLWFGTQIRVSGL